MSFILSVCLLFISLISGRAQGHRVCCKGDKQFITQSQRGHAEDRIEARVSKQIRTRELMLMAGSADLMKLEQ
jgi:hypothetical protein